MIENKIKPPQELDLKKAIFEERLLLTKAQVPIVTVSASYRKELADKYQAITHTASDIVFSRAHYSMAEAIRQQAIGAGKEAVISDPINFVSKQDWNKIEFTEKIGKIIARYKILKDIKDKFNSLVREGSPVGKAITKPLLYLTEKTRCPVISVHYETGNILVKNGKTVIQCITDPHIHPQYLEALPSPNITFAVFDEKTKKTLLKEAGRLNKNIEDKQVVVTGALIDPRINKIGEAKTIFKKNEPINIAITTGGLGTNLKEIKNILESFKELLKPPEKIRLFLYASTHVDFRNFFEEYARKNNIRIGNMDDEEARIRILYGDSIIDANENLIKYMFPWAHGIIAKPSGDMAYDAAAAGCFLLFLEPWGSWEENIEKIFIKKEIGFDFNTDNATRQFQSLLKSGKLKKAMEKTSKMEPIYRDGCKNIIKLHATMPCKKK